MKRLNTSVAIATALLALAGPVVTHDAVAQATTGAQNTLTPEQKARIEAARKKAAAKKAQQSETTKAEANKNKAKNAEPKTAAPKSPRKPDKPATAAKPDKPPKLDRKPVAPAVSRPVTTKPPADTQADTNKKPDKPSTPATTAKPDRKRAPEVSRPATTRPPGDTQADKPARTPNTKSVGTPDAAGSPDNQKTRWRNPNVRRQPPNDPPVVRSNPDTGPNPIFSGKRPQSVSESNLRNLEQLKAQRKKVVAPRGNAVVIKEPDQRTIVKRDNKAFIVHNESNRLRRAPNSRTEKQGRNNVTVIQRPNNVQIYNITDSSGHLVRRYRRDADGRETILIDNESRRRKSRWGRNLAIGLGIGAGIVAGAAILNAAVDVPPPRVAIPRDKYIVDYEYADDDDVYEAFSAPPVDRIERRYTLDEVRATPQLRERMRRVDLSDITFDTGSWEVSEGQYSKLERAARGLLRVIERNPNEIFMVEGYTDAVGSEEDNLSLSDRRAETVAVILSEEFGVPAENLTTQGYGEEYLKVPTEGPERLNRRVAIRRITPLISQDERR